MSPEDFVTASPPSLAADSYFEASSQRKSAHRYWLHIGLLLATLVTTSIVGSRMLHDFQANLPAPGAEEMWDAFLNGWRQPVALLDGLPFSLTLLTILLAHEFGHFLTCIHYDLDASLPYFLPGPFLLLGTLGAFIRIRSPIYYRRALFDVAVAGPLAGFVFLLPALAIGLAFSKVIPGIADEGSFSGVPVLLSLMEKAVFPGVATSDIYLHPVARAAWIGVLATAWNLLPIGQLDGGHIIYAVAGKWHKLVSWIVLGLLVVFGITWWRGWMVYSALVFLFGRRHPTIIDPAALGTGRKQLAWLHLIIFLLCFTPAPFR